MDTRNLTDLKRVCQGESTKIPTDIFKKLISKYFEQLENVIENKGYLLTFIIFCNMI